MQIHEAERLENCVMNTYLIHRKGAKGIVSLSTFEILVGVKEKLEIEVMLQ